MGHRRQRRLTRRAVSSARGDVGAELKGVVGWRLGVERHRGPNVESVGWVHVVVVALERTAERSP